MFNEAIMNIYTITFDSWYTERKISNDGRELQVDIGKAQKINSPKYLISAFQTNARTTAGKKLTQQYLMIITSQNILLKLMGFDIQKMRY